MKRQRTWATGRTISRKRNRFNAYMPPDDNMNVVVPARVLPARSYPYSRVPLSTSGYKLNRTELKAIDLAPTSVAVNATGIATPLCIPTVGADMQNRVGRKITIKSVYIRGLIQTIPSGTAGTAGTAAAQMCRFIILADLQPNGVTLTPTDVLGASFTVQSQLNLNNRDRFKIYCDKQYVFDPYMYTTTATQALANASRQIWPIKKYKKLDLEVVFNGTSTGGIADISSGALYMLWVGSNAGVAACNYSLSTRCRYADF